MCSAKVVLCRRWSTLQRVPCGAISLHNWHRIVPRLSPPQDRIISFSWSPRALLLCFCAIFSSRLCYDPERFIAAACALRREYITAMTHHPPLPLQSACTFRSGHSPDVNGLWATAATPSSIQGHPGGPFVSQQGKSDIRYFHRLHQAPLVNFCASSPLGILASKQVMHVTY